MTNVQIIRSGAPTLQIGSSTAPQHPFTSHLPRGEFTDICFFSYQTILCWHTNWFCSVVTGAAAAAVMSSSKGTTVLRPAAGPSSATGQPTVQHIIHQPIQVNTSVIILGIHFGIYIKHKFVYKAWFISYISVCVTVQAYSHYLYGSPAYSSGSSDCHQTSISGHHHSGCPLWRNGTRVRCIKFRSNTCTEFIAVEL